MSNTNGAVWSFLGVGLGLGLGAGFARSGLPTIWRTSSADLLELELARLVIDGKDSGANFEDFPYYLNEQTRVLLTNAAYVHLKQKEFSKFTRNLSPASQTILLTGPAGAESYQQMLARALAQHFQAKLMLLDVNDFISKVQKKYADLKSGSEPAILSSALNHISSSLSDISSSLFTSGRNDQSDNSVPGKTTQVSPLRRNNSLGIQEQTLFHALYKVLETVSKTSPIVLFLRDVERFNLDGIKALFKKLKKLAGPVLVLGSKIINSQAEESETTDKRLRHDLFAYTINIKPPEDNDDLVSWKSQLEEDLKTMQAQDNRNHILEVLAANDVECDDLESISFSDTMLLSNYIEEVIITATTHHLINEKPDYRFGRLIISSKSLAYGLELFQAGRQLQADAEKPEAQKTTGGPNAETVTEASTAEVEKKPADPAKDKPPAKPTETPDNEFEKRLRPEVIPAGEVGVSFQDIGALDNVKESLQELVMLPLRRPELFQRGGLIKPCKGILLFGPPGTGKTMLAKAVATEAGATFINVSMSSITSKWFGEDEKNVRAIFTLAAKVSPTIVFIDEVDSLLGQRSRTGEHEAMRKIKNEFMAHWDGLLTKGADRVLILAATNRPFDLDEAIIRRFERRIMVGLPDAQNREKILRAILSKEQLSEDFDFTEIASTTEGYSGSDLKNLCVAAAYRPVRELLKQEQQEKKSSEVNKSTDEKPVKEVQEEKNVSEPATKEVSQEQVSTSEGSEKDGEITSENSVEEKIPVSFRPLNMEDMKEARKQVSASFASEGAGMTELQEWNELYGEGGSRKKQQLTYFM